MIIRTVKDKNYSVINNTVLRDERLSWRARGIAAFLLTQPDNWTINSDYIWKKGIEGRDAVRNALKELEEANYIHRRKQQDKEGKWTTELALTEVPTTEYQKPTPENQSSENQSSVFQALYISTNDINTNTKKTSSRVEADAPPPPTKAKKNKPDTDPNTKAILDAYIEARGGNGINYGKEGKYAKLLAKEERTPTQVKGCYLWLDSDPWWEDKVISLSHIYERMDKYIVWCEKNGITPTPGNGKPIESTFIWDEV